MVVSPTKRTKASPTCGTVVGAGVDALETTLLGASDRLGKGGGGMGIVVSGGFLLDKSGSVSISSSLTTSSLIRMPVETTSVTGGSETD